MDASNNHSLQDCEIVLSPREVAALRSLVRDVKKSENVLRKYMMFLLADTQKISSILNAAAGGQIDAKEEEELIGEICSPISSPNKID